jgi:hypothetical protein
MSVLFLLAEKEKLGRIYPSGEQVLLHRCLFQLLLKAFTGRIVAAEAANTRGFRLFEWIL